MVSHTKSTKNDTFWLDFFTKNSVSIFKGSRKINVHDMILGLAINGSCLSSDLAHYHLIKKYGGKSTDGYSENINSLPRDYTRLFNGTKKRNSLTKTPFVKNIGTKFTEKKRPSGIYSLTTIGYFVALGLDYSNAELKLIIKNASSISLYFAYINSILEKTSLSFAKKIFIDPLKTVLKIIPNFENGMRFYYPNIADKTYSALSDEIMKRLSEFMVSGRYDNPKRVPKYENVETLINNTLYTQKPKEDYQDFLIEHYYKKNSDEGFYRDHSTDLDDLQLITLVMKSIHFAYYDAEGFGIPPKPRIKIIRSKAWKKHKRLTRPKPNERLEKIMKQKKNKRFG